MDMHIDSDIISCEAIKVFTNNNNKMKSLT